jgi:hypothetical protein
MRFVVDKSRIPPDKLDDPRLADEEAALLRAMRDEENFLQVCVHEAAHAIYMERAGFVPVLQGPVIFYYSDTDTFDSGEAGVSGIAKDGGVDTDSFAMARRYVASGVASSVLIGDGGESIEPGDGQDFEVFSGEFVRLGGDPDEIAEYWEQAKRDVEKDLRSPAFRQQVWDRAREFKRQLEAMIDSTE